MPIFDPPPRIAKDGLAAIDPAQPARQNWSVPDFGASRVAHKIVVHTNTRAAISSQSQTVSNKSASPQASLGREKVAGGGLGPRVAKRDEHEAFAKALACQRPAEGPFRPIVGVERLASRRSGPISAPGRGALGRMRGKPCQIVKDP